MVKRQKYLIDKGVQLRASFSVLLVVSFASILIISLISANVLYNNEKVENIYQIEDNIFNIVQTTALSNDSLAARKKLSDQLFQRHKANHANISRIALVNEYLLMGLVLFLVLQIVVLFLLLIRITHRITGPIHVISSHIAEILKGNDPDLRPLRNRDEFKNFYKLFCDLVNYIRDLKKSGGHSR